MKDLIFNPVDHTYFVGNVEYTSVTTVLKELGLIDYGNIPAHILEYAANRGKHCHKMAELYLKGTLNEEALDPLLVPYLNGLKKFLTNHEVKPIHTEKVLSMESLLVAGTVDFIGYIDGVKKILDWKFVSKVKKTSFLQLGGYRFLYNNSVKEPEEIVGVGGIVHIKPNSYELIKEDFDAEDEFRTLLLSWHIKKKYKA